MKDTIYAILFTVVIGVTALSYSKITSYEATIGQQSVRIDKVTTQYNILTSRYNELISTIAPSMDGGAYIYEPVAKKSNQTPSWWAGFNDVQHGREKNTADYIAEEYELGWKAGLGLK